MATALEVLAAAAITAEPGDTVRLADSTGREWEVTFGERRQIPPSPFEISCVL